ncbi:MAG: DUF58 domain-containing protein [Phycisphaeraceae bacterium]
MPTPDPIAGLDGLYFAARHLVDGLYAGHHASALRGAGVEFHDYRPYTPGDDLRTIDWKLFGRTDRYYLKRYRRETDLNLHVAVDGSASMGFAGLSRKRQPRRPTKFAVAQQLAAALMTLAIRQGDRAGLSVCDRKLRCLHPPTGSLRLLQTMVAELEQAEPSPGPSDLGATLEQLGQTLRGRRATLALVGDLLDEPAPLLDAIDRLRFAGHEVVAFQVLTPDELELPETARGIRMIDPEHGASVNTQPRAVAHRYRRLIREHLDALRRSLAARGIDHVLVNTAEPLTGALRRYLVARAARARQ